MTGRKSRRKGAEAERELARLFANYGFTARRTPNSGGLSVKDDLTGTGGEPVIDGYLIEVKRCETLRLPEWLAKAHAVAGVRTPLLFFRRNRSSSDPLSRWHVVMPAEDYLGLQQELKEWQRA